MRPLFKQVKKRRSYFSKDLGVKLFESDRDYLMNNCGLCVRLLDRLVKENVTLRKAIL